MKTLFEGTAEYYAKYRPPYPPEIFSDIIEKFQLDGTGKLLDIGCGPGTLTLPLAKYFQNICAVDIDPEMIREGKRNAKKHGIKNIQWICESADTLTASIGAFKLITSGASFHWIDREKFSKLAFDIIAPSGGIVILWTGNSLWNKNRNIWEEKVLSIIKKYLGNERRAGDGVFQLSQRKQEDILREAGFTKIETKEYPSVSRILTVEEVIKVQYTNSYAAKGLFRDKVSDFEMELTKELLKLNPKNKFEEIHTAGGIYAWKI